MQKILLLVLLLYISELSSQVLISPYIVYTDETNKFGTFIVQNESDQAYEISVSFVFGFPVSDSLGNVSMSYIEDSVGIYPSVVNWIKAFPRQFLLNPKQRQVIRMTIKQPEDLEPGTYWGRIVTSAVPQSIPTDTVSTGITAQIKFVLNQVTTILYRKEPAESVIIPGEISSYTDSSGVNFLIPFERSGNSPFFGEITARVLNSGNEIIYEEKLNLTVYFNLIKKLFVDFNKLGSGNYTLLVTVNHNEKKDFPESKLIISSPIELNYQFSIP